MSSKTGPHQSHKRGASALTYGLLVGLISVTALAAITTSGDSTDQIFTGVSTSLQNVTEGTTASSPAPAASASASAEIYAFTSHTFTSCGSNTGRSGPSLGSCQSAYSAQGWASNTDYFNQGSFNGYQLWTVPQDGQYRITAGGASSGVAQGHLGNGYELAGTFTLTGGDKLTIVVGQAGLLQSDASTGGGGSFVALGENAATAIPLIIAGGGGGNRNADTCNENNATSPDFPLGNGACATTGNYGFCDNGASIAGQGGQYCNTGSSGTGCPGGTGAGFESNGLDGPCLSNTAPASFRNGLTGGFHSTSANDGGFGGGSSKGNGGCGAGGGYSGGGSHDQQCGGGSSYIDSGATNYSDNGVRSGSTATPGFVTIEKL